MMWLDPSSQSDNSKSARQKRQSSPRNHKQTRLMFVHGSLPNGPRYLDSCEARIWKKDAGCRLIIHIVFTDVFVSRVRVGAMSKKHDHF